MSQILFLLTLPPVVSLYTHNKSQLETDDQRVSLTILKTFVCQHKLNLPFTKVESDAAYSKHCRVSLALWKQRSKWGNFVFFFVFYMIEVFWIAFDLAPNPWPICIGNKPSQQHSSWENAGIVSFAEIHKPMSNRIISYSQFPSLWWHAFHNSEVKTALYQSAHLLDPSMF